MPPRHALPCFLIILLLVTLSCSVLGDDAPGDEAEPPQEKGQAEAVPTGPEDGPETAEPTASESQETATATIALEAEPADVPDPTVQPTATVPPAAPIATNTGYSEPDVYMILQPWEPLADSFRTEDPTNVIDFTSLEQVKANYLITNVGVRLAFQNPRDLPVAVAIHPDITVAGVEAALDGGLATGGTGTATYESGTANVEDLPGANCGENNPCPSFEALAYFDDVLAMAVTDGMMAMYALPIPMNPLNLLDLIAAEPPITSSGSPDDIRSSISFFRVMHDGFGIPHDAMQIYAYDRVDSDATVEEFWPTKYLSVYWSDNGDLVVPRVTTEEVNDQRDTVEAYSLSVVPLDSPYTFSFWDRPLNYLNRLEEPADATLELRSVNCLPGPVCADRLFARQQFRDQYYEAGGFPFEAVEMATAPEAGSEGLKWSVAYLTNQPLLP